MNVAELKKHFHKGKANAYAWPGGYPLFYLTGDGDTLCPKCATKERAQIFRSTHEQARDGWRIDAVDVNWEDGDMLCGHCGERIESAYAEDEPEDSEPEEVSCPACDGPGVLLGQLGSLTHYRCRNCGIDFNTRN